MKKSNVKKYGLIAAFAVFFLFLKFLWDALLAEGDAQGPIAMVFGTPLGVIPAISAFFLVSILHELWTSEKTKSVKFTKLIFAAILAAIIVSPFLFLHQAKRSALELKAAEQAEQEQFEANIAAEIATIATQLEADPNTQETILQSAYNKAATQEQFAAIAKHTSNPDMLDALAKKGFYVVRNYVLANKNTGADTLDWIQFETSHGDHGIMPRLIHHPNTSPKILAEIVGTAEQGKFDRGTLPTIRDHPNLPAELRARIVKLIEDQV